MRDMSLFFAEFQNLIFICFPCVLLSILRLNGHGLIDLLSNLR